MRVHYLHINSHIFGLIFVRFRTTTCAKKALDYFENSRRATYAQQKYAINNPFGFVGYGEFVWGVTASDGPGPDILKVQVFTVNFLIMWDAACLMGLMMALIAPWAAIASLPFAPEIVLPLLDHCIYKLKLKDGISLWF